MDFSMTFINDKDKNENQVRLDVALDTNGASFKIVLWKTTAVVFKVARNSLGT